MTTYSNMKTLFVLIAVTLVYGASIAQSSDKVKLEWKLNDGDSLVYQNDMSQLDSNEVQLNLEKIFDDSLSKSLHDVLAKLKESYGKYEYTTVLNSEEDGINLKMKRVESEKEDESDSAYRVNEVTLIDLKESDGERIAVLQYNIKEFVTGSFNSPFSDGAVTKNMEMTHRAIGEFSVDKGRWISYNGVMSVVSGGLMDNNSKNNMSLKLIE